MMRMSTTTTTRRHSLVRRVATAATSALWHRIMIVAAIRLLSATTVVQAATRMASTNQQPLLQHQPQQHGNLRTTSATAALVHDRFLQANNHKDDGNWTTIVIPGVGTMQESPELMTEDEKTALLLKENDDKENKEEKDEETADNKDRHNNSDRQLSSHQGPRPLVSYVGEMCGGTSTVYGSLSCDRRLNCSPSQWDYWVFFLQAGVRYSIQVNRIDCTLDPAVRFYKGQATFSQVAPGCGTTHTSELQYIASADDTNGRPLCPTSGDWGDPQFFFVPLHTSAYTLAVFNMFSGPNPCDGSLEYQVVVNPPPLPRPQPAISCQLPTPLRVGQTRSLTPPNVVHQVLGETCRPITSVVVDPTTVKETEPQVASVTATAIDNEGQTATCSTQVPIYDPTLRHQVTGSGWIGSAAGAYKLNAALSGRADFRFDSKYKKEHDIIPTGSFQLLFHVDVTVADKGADCDSALFTFQSVKHQDKQEWLLLQQQQDESSSTTTTIVLQGQGHYNGQPDYHYRIWATDGGSNHTTIPNSTPDSVRFQLFQLDGGIETVLYDNGHQEEVASGCIAVRPMEEE